MQDIRNLANIIRVAPFILEAVTNSVLSITRRMIIHVYTYTHIFKMFLCIYNVVIKVSNRVMRKFVRVLAPERECGCTVNFHVVCNHLNLARCQSVSVQLRIYRRC